ncbi:alcohol dehydrogenase catalytic domain-containing protein [Streptomyces sp. NPDC101234]|uniref:alcohol dehydrogenase catalytic domain-containing protein n=1 Tax=Streptomyces sp. NPDC101234 TaxID=3366138 RepID=UPI0038060955
MLAIQLTQFGEPEQSLKVVDIPEPGPPAAGQALIQVEYAPLDHHDLLLAQGVYPVRPELPPDPAAPVSGRVLVRVTAFPLHPGDLQAVEAYRGTAARPVPAGVEATGVVEAIGPHTRVAAGVEVGGRVTVFPHPGAWSRWILADAGAVVAVPDKLSDEVAAQARKESSARPT